MILTLAWKEMREHRGIWLTMVIMTVLGSWALPLIVAMGDRELAIHVSAFTIFGLSATYGVVCGSMMFAGEHEGGTLVFLDIFLGRRGLLWMTKFAIGCVLVLTQAVAVALALVVLKQGPPNWLMGIAGLAGRGPDAIVWVFVLPVVSLEAYAWGLLGSSFSRRVLAGAAIAAAGVTPVWLFAIMSPPLVFFTLQVLVAAVVLGISYSVFVAQSLDVAQGSPPEEPVRLDDRKDEFLEQFEEFERADDDYRERPECDIPVVVPAAVPAAPAVATLRKTGSSTRPAERRPSSIEVLWWLTFAQAWPVLWILAAVSLLVGGLFLSVSAQVIWPLATLLLGVICGTAVFAPEQRDLSYQFMSAQHFPLKSIWRFKTTFWFTVAVLAMLFIVFGYYLSLALRGVIGQNIPPTPFPGTVPELLGPVAFFGIWLVYGFCTGQVFVWLCRKSILAVLISFLVGAAAITFWLPSLLCGGMSNWPLWAPPLIMLLATRLLMRAWAGGRIQESKPMAALIGFGAAATAWSLLNFGYRAYEISDVGQPVNRAEFRARIPQVNDNPAAKAVNDAVGQFNERNELWLASIAELPRLEVGVIETPRSDLHLPIMKHVPVCRGMADELLRRARAQEPGSALDHLVQVLALSRNLRNKVTVESYLVGVEMEKDALTGLDQWLTRGKPAPKLLRQALNELNRHADKSPPPMDCLQTECFRSGGFLVNPGDLIFPAPGVPARVPERWLIGSVVLSLEAPWEAERNQRIWQLVWAGLFRAIETPHWELPEPTEEIQAEKAVTRKILQGWLPATDGPGATVSRERLARLVDRSWLADERLFCSVVRLREASTRGRCRVDAMRLAMALSLYQLDESKEANVLQELTPKYLPAGLPMDPYSGQSFRYRRGNDAVQAAVWSTGPDRLDHGGHKDGGDFPDAHVQWSRGKVDLITPVPQWR